MSPTKPVFRSPRRPRLLLAALGVLAATAAMAVPATAAPQLPGGRAETNLVLNGENARLVGSSALVPVRCLGSRDGLCNGTVTLRLKGRAHKVPFSLVGGSAQGLVVPVGSGRGLSGETATVEARTLQSTGGYSRSVGSLQLR